MRFERHDVERACALALAGIWLLAACSPMDEAAERPLPDADPGSAQGGVAIDDPRIPEPAADVAALYLTLRDRGGKGDRLLSVSTPIARQARLHETRHDQGRIGMHSVDEGIPIPPGGTVRLQPGGYHVMLMQLTQPVTKGRWVDVELEFERAGRRRLRVPVVAVSEAARTRATAEGP